MKIIFKGLSVAKNCLRPENARLTVRVESATGINLFWPHQLNEGLLSNFYSPQPKTNPLIRHRRVCNVWCCGVVVITTAQLHSTNSELSFCTGSNPADSMSEIQDGEDLWQWSWLEIRLNPLHWSNIPQKQFIK